jgi:hypothetical protein
MNPDTIADLMTIFRPALQALAEGPKGRAEAAFARLEVDVARWAVRHGVTPEALDRARSAFRRDEGLRLALNDALTHPDHLRPAVNES